MNNNFRIELYTKGCSVGANSRVALSHPLQFFEAQ
nr:MAG TPA: hypothetical protein [Caudoviricetes sp.]